MNYTAAIRTLGKAGEKYQQTLDSICAQTIQPDRILVYIAEGYPIPKETCGREEYIYVKKGMVAQRALPYDEVETEYILFLDDDVYLPENGVELLYKAIKEHDADVVSPNTFENHKTGWKTKLRNIILCKQIPFKSNEWAYKVLKSGGFAYNSNPVLNFYWSESNAGPCFLCRKKDFLSIKYEEDREWLDSTPYALPDDQVMFYKMHLNGLKVATLFNSGITHLDAGTSVAQSSERSMKILYSEIHNQIIFCRKYIWKDKSLLKQALLKLPLNYSLLVRLLFSLSHVVKGDLTQFKIITTAIKDARKRE